MTGNFSGYFKDSVCDGVGRFTQLDGSVYIGTWRNNNYNGKGILTLPDGSVKKGFFKDDKFKLAFEFNDSDLF